MGCTTSRGGERLHGDVRQVAPVVYPRLNTCIQCGVAYKQLHAAHRHCKVCRERLDMAAERFGGILGLLQGPPAADRDGIARQTSHGRHKAGGMGLT